MDSVRTIERVNLPKSQLLFGSYDFLPDSFGLTGTNCKNNELVIPVIHAFSKLVQATATLRNAKCAPKSYMPVNPAAVDRANKAAREALAAFERVQEANQVGVRASNEVLEATVERARKAFF